MLAHPPHQVAADGTRDPVEGVLLVPERRVHQRRSVGDSAPVGCVPLTVAGVDTNQVEGLSQAVDEFVEHGDLDLFEINVFRGQHSHARLFVSLHLRRDLFPVHQLVTDSERPSQRESHVAQHAEHVVQRSLVLVQIDRTRGVVRVGGEDRSEVCQKRRLTGAALGVNHRQHEVDDALSDLVELDAQPHDVCLGLVAPGQGGVHELPLLPEHAEDELPEPLESVDQQRQSFCWLVGAGGD